MIKSHRSIRNSHRTKIARSAAPTRASSTDQTSNRQVRWRVDLHMTTRSPRNIHARSARILHGGGSVGSGYSRRCNATVKLLVRQSRAQCIACFEESCERNAGVTALALEQVDQIFRGHIAHCSGRERTASETA